MASYQKGCVICRKLPDDCACRPSASRSNAWPIDQHIRRFGYTIHSRMVGWEPVWRAPDGRLVDQDDVLKEIAAVIQQLEAAS